MGATVFIILIIIGIVSAMNGAMGSALKKHPHLRKPRIILWILLGIGIGYLGIEAIYAIYNTAFYEIEILYMLLMLMAGIGYFAADVFLAAYGFQKAYSYYIALAAFFFGYSVWFLLFGILMLINAI
ncbi:hypothetical protein [Christensenella tenuis]|jgi:hypothetical protein|uniref:Uncharacterized protein n=1 Tax=Christensenella tenuis TaxID=2763033 RepID=A0ABR7EHU7_9FIRM|nr:hypothetical protein [Christensenella tenuis]MBC5648951.1 hypothetical protein [Christensenella tenuis]